MTSQFFTQCIQCGDGNAVKYTEDAAHRVLCRVCGYNGMDESYRPEVIEYPLGGVIEHYDIEREKKLTR